MQPGSKTFRALAAVFMLCAGGTAGARGEVEEVPEFSISLPERATVWDEWQYSTEMEELVDEELRKILPEGIDPSRFNKVVKVIALEVLSEWGMNFIDNHGHPDIEERLDRLFEVDLNEIERRFSSIEDRLGSLGRTEGRLSSIEDRFNRLGNLEERVSSLERNLERLEEGLGEVAKRAWAIERDIYHHLMEPSEE